MANAVVGPKIYIDSTGVVTDKRTQVTSIIFTPSANNDEVVFKEVSGGDTVLVLQSANGKTTLQYRFEICPLTFINGIYVDSITSGACCTLVTTTKGKD